MEIDMIFFLPNELLEEIIINVLQLYINEFRV